MEPVEKKSKVSQFKKDAYDLPSLVDALSRDTGHNMEPVSNGSQECSFESRQDFPILVDAFTREPIEMNEKNLQHMLQKIERELVSLNCSMMQKRPKVTLQQLNTKLDLVISLLKKWEI